MHKDFDVLIVGGGLVGIALALTLANHPIKVGIVEAKKNATTDDQRAIALSLTSQRIFSALGLWSKIKSIAAPIREIHVSHQHHFGSAHFSAHEHQTDAFGYVIAAQQLNNILYQALHNQSTLELICPAEVKALQYQHEQNIVTVQTGTELLQLHAKLVVAADGAHSTVRQLKNINIKTWDYQQSAIVAQIHLARDHHFVAHERFNRDGPLAMLPFAEKISTMIWTLPTLKINEYMSLNDEKFLQLLQKQFGYRLGRFLAIDKRQTFPLHMLSAEQQIQVGLVLIGNAVRTLHPIAAQGFNLGLRDVAALAQIITQAIASGKNPGTMAELEKYVIWRESDQQQTLNFTHKIVRLFSSPHLPLTLFRDLGLIGLDIFPPLKNKFIRQHMGFKGKLPKLMCDTLL